MKRSPLRRTTSLKRRTPLARKRSRARRQRVLVQAAAAHLAGNRERADELIELADAPRRRTKYARRDRNLEFMRWVKTLPCALARPLDKMPPEWIGGLSPCPAAAGATEAHHAGRRALGRKAPDDTCIPLCPFHHAALTDRRKPFRGWPRGAVKAWELAMIELYQRRYAEHVAGRDAAPY